MHLSKILFLLAIGLLCTNARVLKRKIRQRVAAPSCGCPLSILEPTYGGFGASSCKKIFLDELSNCGCQYIDSYGVLNPELPNYGRVPAIRLPNTPVLPNGLMPFDSFDAEILPVGSYEVLPAINLPGLCEFLPRAMPYACESQCPCQTPMAFQFVETCGCNLQNPIMELPIPILQIPTESCIQAPKCLPIQLPSCGCQNMPCGCQKTPCGCQNIPYGCQNMPRRCQNVPCSCPNMPCGSQNCNCNKCQNLYVSQLQALELPCACQSCQLSPVELPVYGYGCQSLPPPVIGCEGKYLRQVVIQPPFL